jgi:tetratricopeptide (TPR) repeat protein
MHLTKTLMMVRILFLLLLIPHFSHPLLTPLTTSQTLFSTNHMHISKVLPPDLISQTLSAAEEFHSKHKPKSELTYTLQFGQKEAHLADLPPSFSNLLHNHINSHIFPLIKSALPLSYQANLNIRDSIIIQYDATKQPSLGQPMHADKSTISVNIALSPPTSFTGGGTFFPDLLPTSQNPVVLPSSLGSGIIHLSSRRHAGVSLSSGVRSILVIFIDLIDSPLHQALELQSEASALIRSSKHAPAIDLLTKSLSLHPLDPTAYHLRSTCHLSLRSPDLALTDCLQAAELSPNDARIRNDLGVALQKKGDEEGARRAWREAIRLLDEYNNHGCIPAIEGVR